jgi:8-oxo-dGTP diphosphatase
MTKRENPYSAVRALIVKDNKLLVVGGDGDGDFYCLPGGRIDFGEDLASAVKREVYEETGLKIEVGSAVFAYDFVLESRDFHVVNVVFCCKSLEGTLSADWKDQGGPVSEARFVDLEELQTMNVFPRFLREGKWLSAGPEEDFYKGQERN